MLLYACSTPFGIEDRVTVASLAPFSRFPCAQRLSASKIGSHRDQVRELVFSECSTPFGIEDRVTGVPATERRPAGVLNAFRHRRSGHAPMSKNPDLLKGCSTPFGIEDRVTCGGWNRPQGWRRAQRLSASKIGSPHGVGSELVLPECSTPFGIEDRVTKWSRRRLRGKKSAQRLSASKIGSHRLPPSVPDSRGCAQRLSASKIGSQRRQIKPQRRDHVLNAFRHRRSGHPIRDPDLAAGLECSTPFGIEDRVTQGGPHAPDHPRVLNAFRHRRSGHCGRHQHTQGPLHVLNAFRHRRSGHTPIRSLPFPSRWSAQRLSASKIGSRGWPCGPGRRSSSAQRLSASKIGSRVIRPSNPQMTMCSTPFGIEDRVTKTESWLNMLLYACSTPFGIEDRVTRVAVRARAEILECSTPFGIEDRVTVPPPVTNRSISCSTPFGIEDRVTRDQAQQSADDHVLNAFRHRRSGHEDRVLAEHAAVRVLNAFRHRRSGHSRFASAVFPLSVCSTPFGIEDRVTPGPGAGTRVLGVLNAFRHRRSGHWSSCDRKAACGSAQRLSASKIGSRAHVKEPRPPQRVLNAFRHRRSGHVRRVESAAGVEACSTPFGIEDRVTPRRGLGARASGVLNAFRHRRSGHEVVKEALEGQEKCSTPFGIEDRVTPSPSVRPGFSGLCSTPFGIEDRVTAKTNQTTTAGPCAQRLSASKIGSPNPRSGPCRRVGVLNAFRHRRSGHPRRTTCTRSSASAQRLSASKIGSLWSSPAHPRPTSCAQRLSASKIGSHPNPITSLSIEVECSTPFGIEDRVTK